MESKEIHIKPLQEIELPTSKSISNRLLVLNALLGNTLVLDRVSTANDTRIMQEALQGFESKTKLNLGNAGTAFRFLTAFFALKGKDIILEGSEEMEKRPIKPLVDALNDIGANISYLKEDGYPPIQIEKSTLSSKSIRVSGDISSQYLTALVMIAPFMDGGLQIEIISELRSKSYLDMTVSLMQSLGFSIVYEENTLTIAYQEKPIHKSVTVESDWSSASYWYSYLAFSNPAEELMLKNLRVESIQGDAVVANLYRYFGVLSEQTPQGVRITKEPGHCPIPLNYSFVSTPDIVQTVAVTCVGLGIKGIFHGVSHLKHKETDRLVALSNELKKLHVAVEVTGDVLTFERKEDLPSSINVSTYNDHRMAMSFAPLAKLGINVRVENPKVVDKSYITYWDNFESK